MADSSTDDSSDDENVNYLIASRTLPGFDASLQARKGSQKGRSENRKRDFQAAFQRLWNDYFSDNPKYKDAEFERRFRLSKDVFVKIFDTIHGEGIFKLRTDAAGKQGIHPIVRMAAALRMLAYGTAADSWDEYLQMSEDSTLHSMKSFSELIVRLFENEYLREPNEDDLKRIISLNTARGFPGCLGSIDCQHWAWKNCPLAWAGQFRGKEKSSTMILEAIADGDLWIWHAFFGSPGSLNDINVLDRSPTIGKIEAGHFPPSFTYTVNGHARTLPYYLADGIYPNWAIFVKTIKDPTSPKQKAFSECQESVRKDVERAFGVLVARWHILQRPARLWSRGDIKTVMKACIILHNMMVERRRDSYTRNDHLQDFLRDAKSNFGAGPVPFTWHSRDSIQTSSRSNLSEGMWATLVSSRSAQISNTISHFSLKADLIEHVWKMLPADEI